MSGGRVIRLAGPPGHGMTGTLRRKPEQHLEAAPRSPRCPAKANLPACTHQTQLLLQVQWQARAHHQLQPQLGAAAARRPLAGGRHDKVHRAAVHHRRGGQAHPETVSAGQQEGCTQQGRHARATAGWGKGYARSGGDLRGQRWRQRTNGRRALVLLPQPSAPDGW